MLTEKLIDFREFDCGMGIGARHLGLSVLETPGIFTHRKRRIKKQTHGVSGRFVWKKFLVDERGPRRSSRLGRANRKVTQIHVLKNNNLRMDHTEFHSC